MGAGRPKKLDVRLDIEIWPIGKPKPYERNPRKIPDSAVGKVANSIKAFGFRQPIVVDEKGVILVGHTRLKAAQSLGLTSVPIHVAKGLSPADQKAYRLADNRTGEESQWDDALLGLELGDLTALDFDLGPLGFDPEDFNRLTRAEGGVEGEDETPEIAKIAISQLGDIWQLGGHAIACGDCTDKEVVARLLEDVAPNLMVTDPPYGVDYDPTWRADRGVNKNKKKLGLVKNDDQADWRTAWVLFQGDVAYVWSADLRSRQVVESLEKSDFALRAQIIWAKDRFALGRGDYHFQHEVCWYGVRSGRKSGWSGGRSQTTLWQIAARDDSGHGHGTQKPVECMRRPMLNNSKPGDFVYDPFLGSGTSIIAAETTKRVCLGCEIDPLYVDLSVRRWQEFTGESATLRGDGRTFDEISEGREEAA